MSQNGCLVCGGFLEYGKLEKHTCLFCGKEFEAEVSCVHKHYICDHCHSSEAVEILEKFIAVTELKDPIQMADIIMHHPSFKMHGTEHHYLVPAVLVKSIQNSGYEVNNLFFNIVKARGSSLPGGTCGYWGACATAIGCGISSAIYLKTSPLSTDNYSLVHSFTADAINEIAKKPGPRCCKRNTYTSILAGIKSFKKYTDIEIQASTPVCSFFKDNNECLGLECPYFPGANK
ncbi:MAG: hypothetical protein A2015_02300 [Spirochaetes bacterium GWF1_31_7]|nr:MAG: hypothetical protein A2Y30_06150 [Spirochaetes bacterium GWE1_32_154]OHD50746.1 MAG: hypothetical protein A2015_02300 [Spirochaetes bacterium GWF1_31_7]OHD74189.1 MAG: hypothetical protein A2355_05665 [Spirochaetes bacterium RIFOXYB1_FULL_32_8]HBD95083.1 SAM-dependent methyltransferase [Spirochaetia bacterium]HBI38031.1 SAM-dependent methyltransferase [Spirochaetia bacterium]